MEGTGGGRRSRGAELYEFGRPARVAGLVGPRRPGHRDPPVATLPLGAAEGSRPAGLRAQNSRQGNSPGARRRAPVCVPAGSCRPWDCGAAVSPKTVSYEQLAGISACLVLALVAHLHSLPVWVLVTVAVSAGIRLLLAHRGRAAPTRGVRLVIAVLAVALL